VRKTEEERRKNEERRTKNEEGRRKTEDGRWKMEERNAKAEGGETMGGFIKCSNSSYCIIASTWPLVSGHRQSYDEGA